MFVFKAGVVGAGVGGEAVDGAGVVVLAVAGGSEVETGVAVGGVEVAAPADDGVAWVLSEASCSRAPPENMVSRFEAEGPGVGEDCGGGEDSGGGSGWLSTGLTGAASGERLGSASSGAAAGG